MYFPKPLLKGARVALLAPSGPVGAQALQGAVRAVAELGLSAVVYESARSAHGYFAGSDALRASDLNAAFADASIDGIWCLRGGYGAQRLLPMLDYKLIAKNPKFFAGYSDITALHLAFTQCCGFATWHAPMPATQLTGSGLNAFSTASLRHALFGEPCTLENPAEEPLGALRGGRARGPLTGGNLSVAAASLGTPWEMDTAGKILFLEDVDEEPYCADRMLTQLRNAGKLSDCAGVLLGYWTRCETKSPAPSLTMEEICAELFGCLDVPVLTGFACGHGHPTLSLRMGGIAELDSYAKTVREGGPP